MNGRIEYLEVWRAMLVHQEAHGALLPSWPGDQGRPWQVCTRCLTSGDHKGDGDAAFFDVKRRFAWAIPSEPALAAIAEWSPRGVVEIGAGGGLLDGAAAGAWRGRGGLRPRPGGRGDRRWSAVA